MKQLRFAAKARADIASIFQYLAADNLNSAERVVDQIEAACWDLIQLPERYPVDIVRPAGALRRRPVGRYNVYYRVAPGRVEIARVLHSAQDISAIFGGD